MKVIFVHCFLLISTAGICQFLQGNWNIGQNLRLTFLENGIEIDTSSSMLLGEGSVTFSDVTGNLMFYTDGQSLWNAQHDLMPNGTGLAGGLSSTQACLTVPEISNNSQFYLFTTTATGTPLGLTYSKIDMDLDGGSGDVISSLKNIVLDSSVSEKLIGISKCDKSGYWVLAHDAGNNQLLAYEIGTSGLNTTPVISYGAISTLPFGSSNIGYLKASFDGSIIAMAHFGLNKLEIMQFDRQTGLASNPIVIPIDTSTGSTTSANFPYGIEISPNGRFVYVASRTSGTLLSFDLISYDSVAIALSRDTIFKSTQTGSLQYGPDCKLYITGEQHLHVLENPNQIGGGANFLENEVALLGRYAGEGLPNYVAGEQCYHISDQTICISDTLKLEYFDSCLNSITWDFDDEASSTNIQTTNQAQHIFSNTGLYFIKLKARYAGDTLNFFARIKVIAPPPANGFLPDSLFNCTDGALSANFDLGEFSYQWTNGYDSEYVIFDSAGLYSLTLSNQCGIAVDSVRIVFLGQPSVSLPADTSICENVTLQISPKIAGAQLSYNWWRGDTSISISIALNYDEIIWVEVSNRCGTDRDSMQIKSLSSPDVSWFSDSILCGLATPIVPNPASDNATYFLVADSVDGDTLNPWEIRIDSLYFLIGLNTCDTLIRQAHLSPNNIIAISSSDETICDDPITISADWPESSYLWNTGETSSTIEVDEPGSYSATVTNGSCSLSLTKNVLLNPDCDSVDCKFFFPNVLSPNADGINDLFRISNSCENEVFDVFIYNRWGVNLIQQRCSGYFSWDGYTNGTRAPDGTYYLVIQNEGKSLNGYFTLLRD